MTPCVYAAAVTLSGLHVRDYSWDATWIEITLASGGHTRPQNQDGIDTHTTSFGIH